MSYYQVCPSYYRNPGPVYPRGGDWGAPVPGWGALPNMAGPARLGVGQAAATQQPVQVQIPTEFRPEKVLQEQDERREQAAAEQEDGKPFPWWGWVVGAFVLGGVGAVALNYYER